MYRKQQDPIPVPHPEQTPDAVISLQLDALQNNDLTRNNHGIRLAYQFASPVHRRMVGGEADYVHMLHSPLYAPLIGFQVAEIGAVRQRGGSAQVFVTLHRGGGDTAGYLYSLSRQSEGVYAGCWLIDGMLPVS